jgi:hypothetical protein
MSISVESSNKSIKIGIGASPVPTQSRNPFSDTSARLMNHNTNTSHRKPSFNVQILAATILFSAWEYYDHWPVPLLQVYAEDCFGPRLWVDHKHSELLTANLVLALNDMRNDVSVRSEHESDVPLLEDAATVADTYRTFFQAFHVDSQQETLSVALPSTNKRTTLFSQLSSSSFGSSDSRRVMLKGEPKQKRQRRFRPTTAVESQSESEDEIQSANKSSVRPTKDAQLGDDCSSGKEDSGLDGNKTCQSDLVTEVKSFDVGDAARQDPSDTCSQPVSSMDVSVDALPREPTNGFGESRNVQFRYPIQQKLLHPERIRKRYFGKNLQAAHDVVFSSLTNRLDLKSKQNSSLLVCLPSFTGIPRVRALVAANLEKWLQSPALAGLARSLFSSTVTRLQIVDPPLPEDIKVIDCIIEMKLRTNQVKLKRLQCECVAPSYHSNLLTLISSHSNAAQCSY